MIHDGNGHISGKHNSHHSNSDNDNDSANYLDGDNAVIAELAKVVSECLDRAYWWCTDTQLGNLCSLAAFKETLVLVLEQVHVIQNRT